MVLLIVATWSETPQNDPFNINGGQTVSGQIGQQGENIDQSGTVNNGGNGVDNPSDCIPITWPLGTYGLPMPKLGCPSGWHEGTRLHDTEDSRSRNAWSVPYDLAGNIAINDMEQKFCMKTQDRTSEYNLPWPTGQYCIFKKGNCPGGFENKTIHWDDEDNNNHNSNSGQIPDGKYGHDTLIYYCCRSDGNATDAIILPTDSPFVLFKSNSNLCQQVRGMEATSEFFYWDNEDTRPNSRVQEGGPGARLVGTKKDIQLDYCYYVKKESETPQNDPFDINGGQTVSGKIGQQGENIDQSGTVNNDDTGYYYGHYPYRD
ncbi:hypothetical protein OS493_027138 [Desmophyllum pertusum]|uniref:Apextrin C-terminal domain-containing protein n=1 Tax=Desmophyllum pertusum TaxID=174260 RepID=A0A9W9ZYA7_9CNID|nr:hypothetical protein OS493_027138 [Desmophyllum pertusum]